MRQTSSIKANFIYSVSYELLALLIPIATTPYLTRILGAEKLGVYAFSFSIAQYFYLFIMLGLKNYGNRSISKVRDSEEKLSKTFCSIYALQLICGVIFSFLYFIYCFTLASDRLTALAFSLYVISGTFDVTWFFWGLEQFKITSVRSMIVKILSTIMIFAFVKNESHIVIYCLIVAGGLLLSQLLLLPGLFKKIKLYIPSWREIAVHIKPNLFLFLTVIAVSIFKYMDKIMLGFMSSMTEVGYYEASERIIAVPTAVIVALGNIMLSRATNLVSKDENRNKVVLKASVLFAMFLSSSMCFGIMGISKEFVPFFFGSDYSVCTGLFLILLPSCIFMSFANVIRTQYLLPKNNDKVYVTSAFLGMGVNLITNGILIPLIGARGAAVGTLIAEIVVCAYQVYSIRREIRLGELIYCSLPFLFSGIGMFGVLFSFELRFSLPCSLVIKILTGVVLYLMFMVVFCRLFKLDLRREYEHLNS